MAVSLAEKKSVEELRKKASQSRLSYEEIHYLSRKWLEPTLERFVESKLKEGVNIKKFPIDELSNLLGERIVDHWIYYTQSKILNKFKLKIMLDLSNNIRNPVICEVLATPVKIWKIPAIKTIVKATPDTDVEAVCVPFDVHTQEIFEV
jgi:hypothetical protein